MNENKKTWSMTYGGRELTLETNRLAKQADGSALVSCEGTQVLVTVCSAQEVKDGQDFFPLLVEYTEKFYAAGKFLGGFKKREGRPGDAETLAARLIDRPLRPLFPEGYMFDTVVSCTVLSYNPEGGDPEVLAGLGASAALTISDIPFNGPIGTAKVGRLNGEYILNPTASQMEETDLEISVAASSDAILMVEGEAHIVPEAEVLGAIWFAHDNIKEYVDLLQRVATEVGREKREFISAAPNETLMGKISSDFLSDARECISIVDKMERQRAIKSLEAKVATAMEKAPSEFGMSEEDSFKKEAAKGVDELLYKMMRADILDEEKRIGNRKVNEVRPIETEANILTMPHGSSLFTRGETQVMATVTIGGKAGEQMSDTIHGLSYSNFYLHYNFPPYSVGEARGVRGVGRRELGHGNLAERGVKSVMPKEFPYTTRVVCEVLESNGSSSMGSVCSASMALMDAGVPLVAPVAGIAMGLISEEGGRYKILTDILGDEDHLGDMDFKVAGTTEGITAIQMDIKITGLTREIVETAMAQAREGRLHILGEMAKTIATHRPDFRDGVPRIEMFKIPTDKIGALIGPGGKNIKQVQEDFAITMEIEEDGTVKVLGTDPEAIQNCIAACELQINGPKVGTIYEATVVTLKEYGAFVDIVPGVSGLVHVSEISDKRVNDVAEYLTEGDKVQVKVVEVDRMGRLKLSIKEVQPLERK